MNLFHVASLADRVTLLLNVYEIFVSFTTKFEITFNLCDLDKVFMKFLIAAKNTYFKLMSITYLLAIFPLYWAKHGFLSIKKIREQIDVSCSIYYPKFKLF